LLKKNRYFTRTGLAAAVVMLALAMTAPRSLTANISVIPGDHIDLVSIDGPLTADDAGQFLEKTKALSKAMIVFRSGSGNVIAGIKIGEAIRLKKFLSVVVGRCASACALAWLGGVPRVMTRGALIGFHVSQENGTGNAFVSEYLNRIGLPDSAVVYITRPPAHSVTWLTPSEAQGHGIDTGRLELRSSSALAPAP
jgi:hypothetical protein